MATREQIDAAVGALGGSVPSAFSDVSALDMLSVLVDEHKTQAKLDEVRLISCQIMGTLNEPLNKLGEALRHRYLKEKPTTPRLGYELAGLYKKLEQIPQNDREKKMLRDVLSYLDVADYVFAHTHYDECDNGFFFRRS